MAVKEWLDGSLKEWKPGKSCSPQGLGLGLLNIFSEMSSGTEAPSATLPMTPSQMMQSTPWRKGMASREIWTGWRGGIGEPSEVQ